jgi:hypothetical protein
MTQQVMSCVVYTKSVRMNEFLLFAFIMVYLTIRHGAPTDGRSDRQGSAGEQSSHPDEEQ